MDPLSYSVEDGEHGKRLVLQSVWNPDIGKLMQDEGITDLWVNYARGFPGNDVSFLAKLPFLEALNVIVYGVKNLESVEALPKLKTFYNGCRDKTRIDFTSLSSLERCGLDWHPRISSLLECQTLQWINIGRYPDTDLNGFSQLKCLQSLHLVGVRLATLERIGILSCLQELSLAYVRSLHSLDGVPSGRELQRLEVCTCFNINSIAEVSSLSQLKWLDVSHCHGIDSRSPIDDLWRLEHVSFVASTDILDGNLFPLTQLPALREVFFKDRKHYTHRRTAFPPWNQAVSYV